MSYKVVSGCFSRSVVIAKPQQFLRNGSCVCNYSKSVQDAKPFKSIPGLSSLPYIGILHHFLPVIGQYGPNGNLFNIIGDLHKQFGPIVRLNGVFGRADTVMLFDPVDIDQVYRSQESNPLRPGFETLEYYREHVRKDKFEGFQGLATSHGAQWRDLRTKVNPAFLKIKLVQLYTPPLDEIVQDFVDRLKRLKEDETYLRDNLDVEVEKWALECLGLVGLGARLGCLNDKLTPEVQQLIDCAKYIIQKTFQLDFLPKTWRYIATPTFKKLMKVYEKQWELSEMYIKQATKRINEREHDIPDGEKSIIEKLLAIDERVAIVMANEMLMAGIDTVSFTLVGVLYNLASNPEKQETLRQELRSDDNQKRYLKACLKETLRIRSVLPSNLRRTDKDHVVRGYHIPPGVDVVVPSEYLSNLEEFYPQPNKFIPERWLADKTDPLFYGNAHPMVTLPFGFGIRSCIGRRLAELEVELMVKKLIEQFKVTWEGPPIKSGNKFINYYEKPYNFRFEANV
ncbi:unnamed protein product [Arctia plantaginis]|uniref:Cytochrome P450 n=1 Tax=Arctia plantaginis TaxID=874455 RepID=A0A8S0YQE5_ARCPL|nr:unnamed protein product [Arctia plantaginis]